MHDAAVKDRPGPAVDDHDVIDAVLGASRALVGVAARSLAGLEDEVTLAQYRMLVLLCSRGPQRLAELAAALDVNPSTATRMTDRLVAKKLARRNRVAADRRTVRIAVTEHGRGVVDHVTARRRREIAAIVRPMPARTQQLLVTALRLFADAAGEVPEQTWAAGWE